MGAAAVFEMAAAVPPIMKSTARVLSDEVEVQRKT